MSGVPFPPRFDFNTLATPIIKQEGNPKASPPKTPPKSGADIVKASNTIAQRQFNGGSGKPSQVVPARHPPAFSGIRPTPPKIPNSQHPAGSVTSAQVRNAAGERPQRQGAAPSNWQSSVKPGVDLPRKADHLASNSKVPQNSTGSSSSSVRTTALKTELPKINESFSRLEAIEKKKSNFLTTSDYKKTVQTPLREAVNGLASSKTGVDQIKNTLKTIDAFLNKNTKSDKSQDLNVIKNSFNKLLTDVDFLIKDELKPADAEKINWEPPQGDQVESPPKDMGAVFRGGSAAIEEIKNKFQNHIENDEVLKTSLNKFFANLEKSVASDTETIGNLQNRLTANQEQSRELTDAGHAGDSEEVSKLRNEEGELKNEMTAHIQNSILNDLKGLMGDLSAFLSKPEIKQELSSFVQPMRDQGMQGKSPEYLVVNIFFLRNVIPRITTKMGQLSAQNSGSRAHQAHFTNASKILQTVANLGAVKGPKENQWGSPEIRDTMEEMQKDYARFIRSLEI